MTCIPCNQKPRYATIAGQSNLFSDSLPQGSVCRTIKVNNYLFDIDLGLLQRVESRRENTQDTYTSSIVDTSTFKKRSHKDKDHSSKKSLLEVKRKGKHHKH